MFYFYVLRSKRDKAYYYGSTMNLKKRYMEHKKGLVDATKHRLPVTLVYYEAYLHEATARSREKQVKKSGSPRKTLLNRIEYTGL